MAKLAGITLSLDATRDALDRAANAIRLGMMKRFVVPADAMPWKDLSKKYRQRWRHAVADAVAELGDPKTAAALREIIALLEEVGP